jgi:hypothetical protein
MARGEEMDTRAAQSADLRSVAQLNMLHSMAATLASLDDVNEIAAAITEELRTILDYHNCRVYVLQDDGWTLMPIAFRGEIFYNTSTRPSRSSSATSAKASPDGWRSIGPPC